MNKKSIKALYVLLFAKMNRKVKYKFSASLLTGVFMFTLVFSAGVAQAALQAVGPIGDPVNNGYPTYFQDQTGLALELCLVQNLPTDLFQPCLLTAEFDPDPLITPGIPAIPIGTVLSGDFPDESFYFAASADLSPDNVRLPGRNQDIKILWGAALEQAFLAGITPGAQSMFLRTQVDIAGLIPGETYTVNTPYGPISVVADDIGGGRTRFEDIVVCNVGTLCNFSLILPGTQTNMGPFLKWDPAVLPLAPAGFIGDPNVTHTIIGGPIRNNISVTGTSVGGVGIDEMSTDQFSISGKIAIIDTVAPVIVSTTPASVPVNSSNVVLSANITDDLGVTGVTADLGALSNTFSATLNNTQEVPATVSTATGTGAFTIDANANTLTYNISASGLQGGAITGMHIHGSAVPPDGAIGQNSAIAFSLGTTLPASGTWNYPEAMEPEILAGRTYVNIHTTLFPNGEIRGQIIPTPNTVTMIRNAGTATDGTWALILPNLNRAGLFNIPITATDGSNPVTTNHSLAVTVLSGVNVTPPTASINTGLTQQLSASALDQFNNPLTTQPTFTWSSSNNNIATVNSSGLVTAVALGTATITATTDGLINVAGTSAITVTAASVCQTAADIDGSGTISFAEVLSYITSWKAGNVVFSTLLQAIGFWKAAVGC
ncbi:MAG: CHRD domain-containing protein [Candidatus Paceibacterota bacterium]|jgi:hypothetical protein